MSIDVSYPAEHIAMITINNPKKRNAMTRKMLQDLANLWDSIEVSDCRAVVITGAGDKAFSAGADVSGDLSADESTAAMINRALLKTDPYPKPIISAVNGTCAGGGVELMLSSDIRFASQEASFGLPEVKWGIYPFGGATSKLTNQINYVDAMRLILSAEMVSASEALRVGLINQIIPTEKVKETSIEMAKKIAMNSPVAVQAVKSHISKGLADAGKARESEEQIHGDQVRLSSDFTEGVEAFREKRLPNY